jgi:ubiquinol-cytochrome c reductase cytochrome b subunit
MTLRTNFQSWMNERAPGVDRMLNKHVTEYYAPKNFNFWYYFGTCSLVVLVNQIVTGIFLAMNYTPTAAGAFDSVQYIMRDIHWGWLVRYMHTTGASLFFVAVYLHMFRSLMYGSFKRPRELVWILGILVLLVLMTEAFMGYVLPWGNMSYWGAKVIITLFSTIPFVGHYLVTWIMGALVPGDPTLNRFFALHVIALPLALLLLVVLHILALHEVGSNNPDGIEIKKGPKGNRWNKLKPADGIPFHPYYSVHDMFAAGVFITIGAAIIFFAPTVGGWFIEHDNFVAADTLVTPLDIKPVWYFTPFYAILRMVPSFWGTAFWGVLAMATSILLLAALPWIDRGVVRSVRYRGSGFRVALGVFVASFLGLGLVGAGVVAGAIRAWFPDANVALWESAFGRLMVLGYFGFFVFLWIYTYFRFERTRPVPERVTYDH